jgi:uncharacterized protein
MGTGLQYMSWVHLDDLIRSIEFVIQNDAIHGPVNVCSPNPVQYNDFIRALHLCPAVACLAHELRIVGAV